MNRSHIIWVCGAVAAFLAVAASASPPMYKFNNRFYDNFVAGAICADNEGWQRCKWIYVTENYNQKGTYENTQASYVIEVSQWNADDGSFDFSHREVTCFVDKNSITAYPNRVTISVVLETESPECSQYGYRYGWSPDGGYWEPWIGFFGIWVIEGEWLDPFSYGSSVSNVKDKSYDGWSGMTFGGLNHCKSNWGDLMTRGGFSQTGPGGNTFFYPFGGPDGPAWGSYSVSSCNVNGMEK